jgi:hypothetical protein
MVGCITMRIEDNKEKTLRHEDKTDKLWIEKKIWI